MTKNAENYHNYFLFTIDLEASTFSEKPSLILTKFWNLSGIRKLGIDGALTCVVITHDALNFS
jgi:hypothetical protein